MKWFKRLFVGVSVGLNFYLFFLLLEQTLNYDYATREIYELSSLNKQLTEAIPLLASNKRDEEIKAIFDRLSTIESYEKDSCYWSGWVGLKFKEGSLEFVSAPWSYGEENPCFLPL